MSTWARQQAEAQRAKKAAETEKEAGVRRAKGMFTVLVTKTVEQQARLGRLAPALADRCFRVHELMGQLRAEWERAEAAEARVRELEAKLEEPDARSA